MAKPRKIRHRQSNKPKAKHQQHKRRGDTLFRKAFEYCQECNADVSLVVRLKDNGQIYIFNSDNRWFPSEEGLEILDYTNRHKTLHYPVPLRITWQELAAAYEA
ncbi:uncharacterized protein AFUA_6G09356 [Aspergillus fumigatus Af293]|uniref:MADS-box domain-containing protein n=2 Tax=Aspergillus fumigatus TaxID=746128 RepID=Q4WMM7_ASPFU|nr:hypothetical protein AFUA_6G09356 [Aspergillus fumigatus Af293]EAL88787.1 hypothetical protein AFUA_6G09356 [Aspergillus fumigatus Af293]EDP48554.1 hypothetical protein AFUB_092720 [Aspergillus fumigatus A1163]KEY84131.1 hypothetical protein BA78_8568 [Aspergillus fumigatus]